MLLAVAFCSLLVPLQSAAKVLECHVDRKGGFTVSPRQWEFVNAALQSRSPGRVSQLIHPSGVVSRSVWYAYDPPEVTIRRESKADFMVNYRDELENGSGPLKLFDQPLVSYPAKYGKRLSFDTWGSAAYDGRLPNKYEPLFYVKLMCKDGRLWIRSYSNGHSESE